MSEPEMDPAVSAAVERARDRGRERVTAILGAPEMLTASEIAGLMQVSVERVEDLYSRGQILAISSGDGRRFPSWQLDDAATPLDGLTDVIAVLGQGWPSYRLLAGDCDGRPAWQCLLDGHVTQVLQQARAEARGDYT